MRSASDRGGRAAASLAGLVGAALLAGCANRGLEREKAFQGVRGADVRAEIASVHAARAKLYQGPSDVLYDLDLAVLHHQAGDWDSSIVRAARAEDDQEALYTRSLSNEAAALAVNDNVRPYRLRPHERLALAFLQLSNYLAKGDLDGAMVETRRSDLLRRELGGPSEETAEAEGALEYLCALAFRAAGNPDDEGIALERALKAYGVAPGGVPGPVRDWAAWRLFRLGRANEPVDAPESVKSLESASSEVVLIVQRGRTPLIGQARGWGGWLQGGGGFAAHWSDPATGRDETVVQAIPWPGEPNGRTFSVNFTLPVLKTVPSVVRGIRVDGPAAARGTGFVALSNASLLERRMSRERPAVIARTVARVAARTLAAQKAKGALATGNPLVDLLSSLSLDFAQGAVEQSDVRSCTWLPEALEIVRIPVEPGDLSLSVVGLDASGRETGRRLLGSLEARPGRVLFRPVALAW